ncbi:CvpA family protein [uncultured Alistipes sp.]|uniref:CvpA family protein n=2 Tax=uncultured Alistipes sp. TaxID=538949 RepID=UPI0025FA69B9|nr:CvpA family protein [uncultured Alistipes sp.]
MNVLDLIVYLALALAVWDGWRRGVVLQLASLVAVAAGIWLAARFGSPVGAWLRLDDAVAPAGGFAAVFVATMIAVALAGRLLRRLCRFAGLGMLDLVLGVVVAAVKYLLVLSVLFSLLERADADHALVDERTVEESRWFRPVASLSDFMRPLLDRAGEYVSFDE